MNEIKKYLQSEDKSYSDGIDLLKKHSTKKEETEFLSGVEEPTAMHEQMLIKRLSNILRIGSQNKIAEEKKVQQNPIVVPKKHFSDADESSLDQTKELTNKLIARKWDNLDEKEKAYFKANRERFEEKKNLMMRNSEIESELKSLHASLPHAESDTQRKDIAEQMANLKKEQTHNWTEIDNFESISKKVEETAGKAVDLIQKRNNLRSKITKLEKTVLDTEHKNFTKRLQTLKEAQDELKQIEKDIQV